MKLNLSSGYIGSELKWIEFFRSLGNFSKNKKVLEYFDKETAYRLFILINETLDAVNDNYSFYQNKVSEYPFIIPQSLKNMWLSGVVDILEIIMSYLSGYPLQKFEVNEGDIKYYKNFINPKSIVQYKSSKSIKKFPLDKSVKNFLEEQFDYCSTDKYFKYPNDSFDSPPAFSKDTLSNSFITAEGDGVAVDGGVILLYSDISFDIAENEVALYSLSESSIDRHQSIAELFLLHVVNPLFFDMEAYSRQDLLRIDSSYQLLLKP